MRILHTADWHLRDRQYGRGFRGKDFVDRANEVIDVAIERRVDCIINGGDTFHINRPSGPMMDVLFDIHLRLKKHGIPMFVVTGNHDAADPSYLNFPDYAAFRDHETPLEERTGVVCIDNQRLNFKGMTIAGFPAATEAPALIAQVKEQPADIVVWHGAIKEFCPPVMDVPVGVDDLPAGPLAWLLGDIHLPGKKRNTHGALVSYPGPIELVERGEPARKVVDLYDLRPGEAFPDDPTEIQLDTRPVVFLTVADNEQADQALALVRETVRLSPKRGPLVFLRFHRSCRDIVGRIQEFLDPTDSVFLCASFHTTFLSAVDCSEVDALRPDLVACVVETVTVDSPLHGLCKTLVSREIAARSELAMWVDARLGENLRAEHT
jgi:DNA repair exonuclease SbcCD nuclease subunit